MLHICITSFVFHPLAVLILCLVILTCTSFTNPCHLRLPSSLLRWLDLIDSAVFKTFISLCHVFHLVPCSRLSWPSISFCVHVNMSYWLCAADSHEMVDEDKALITSNLESMLTLYCKSRSITYDRDTGWMHILHILVALKFTKAELYNCFYAIATKYIPRLVVCISSSCMYFQHVTGKCAFVLVWISSLKVNPVLIIAGTWAVLTRRPS